MNPLIQRLVETTEVTTDRDIKYFHGKTTYSKCGHTSTCRCRGNHREERTVEDRCPLCKAGIKRPGH